VNKTLLLAKTKAGEIKMISRLHNELWEKFEREQIAAESPDYQRNLRYFEGLYREAQLLGVLPGADPLEGIEVDIRIAEVLGRPHVHRTS
jgi:hypothetical protein